MQYIRSAVETQRRLRETELWGGKSNVSAESGKCTGLNQTNTCRENAPGLGTSLYNALKVKEPEAYSRNGKETGVAGKEWIGGKIGDEIRELAKAQIMWVMLAFVRLFALIWMRWKTIGDFCVEGDMISSKF